MKVLVTGAGGFVGGVIANALAQAGHEVTGTIFHRPARGAYRTVYSDLSQPIAFEGKFEAIVHAAGRLPSAGQGFTKFYRDNVVATANLLDFARQAGARRFIFLSTANVYGEPEETNVKEDSKRVNPDDYGLTKYVAERLLSDSCLEHMSLRPASIIGKGVRWGWVTRAIEKFHRDEPVAIYVADSPTSNFVWVDDIAAFIGKLLAMSSWTYDAVNVACHEKVTIREMIMRMKEVTGSRSEIIVKDGGRQPFCLDDSRARELGYMSISPLEMVDRLVGAPSGEGR